MFKRRAKRLKDVNAELNITAFMNLMVVLVPFLLITAVFSQVSILNLNLPEGSSEIVNQQKDPPKALEVMIRKSRFDIYERNSGLLKRIPNTEQGYDYVALNSYLQQVKAHPEFNTETSVTLLMEMDTEYDTLVQTMDAVRLIIKQDADLDESGNRIHGELFPAISMGDAPADNLPAATSKETKK